MSKSIDQKRKQIRHRHLCAHQCVDENGRNVFEKSELYTCAQVVGAGYCAYLCGGSFQCTEKLKEYEDKLCDKHFRQVEKIESKKITSPERIPYYLREKMHQTETREKLSNWQPFDLTDDRKQSLTEIVAKKERKIVTTPFNESIEVDDGMEQMIETLILAIFDFY